MSPQHDSRPDQLSLHQYADIFTVPARLSRANGQSGVANEAR
ncbi:hypothetical protein X753_30885 [Mesorhizobium sp. LNJC399B00]|nr:hypothetical protein X753_30885 [Mesorhizobium sp. LNJC399B00]ESZ23668.1 hypothetical protein X734_25290 [Mesorhizobium sp. L2C084A000]